MLIALVPARAQAQAPPATPPPQDTSSSQVEQLRRELDELRRQYDERIAALEKRLADLSASAGPSAPAPAAPAPTPPPPPAEAAAAPPPPEAPPSPPPAATPSPSAFAKVFNPDMAVIGNMLGAAARTPWSQSDALSLAETEASFQAIVDPYARADFFISFDTGRRGRRGRLPDVHQPARRAAASRSARCAASSAR